MAQMTMQDIARTLRDIDFCMLSTRSENDGIAARPMSNNRDVDYDGDTHFFAHDSARSVAEIGRDPNVSLSFQGGSDARGAPPVFVAVEGRAELIDDEEKMRRHWTAGLDRWFADGPDTPGLVLIRVSARRIHYWRGEDQGEVDL